MIVNENLNYRVDNGLAVITLCRPETLNALTPAMIDGFRALANQAEQDPAVIALAVTGEGRAFCSGIDIGILADGAASSSGLAIQQVCREKKKIYLITGPATSDMTGKQCSPYGVHFSYDTYALAHGTGSALTKSGGDSWFFVTADYAFGYALERDTIDAVKAPAVRYWAPCARRWRPPISLPF